MAKVQETFTGTGRSSSSIQGGSGKDGVLIIDIGAGTTVTLEASQDNGVTWITESTYTADTVKRVTFPSSDALYTLNCTVYGASTPVTLSDGRD